MNTHCMYIFTPQKEAGVSKHLKKIMQLLWTVVTYLLKNVKHGIVLIVLMVETLDFPKI